MINDPTPQQLADVPREVEMVVVRISLYEAAMLGKMREVEFGKFIVEKKRGQPRFITLQGSDQLLESEGVRFAFESGVNLVVDEGGEIEDNSL